jgi:hypothetical protein
VINNEETLTSLANNDFFEVDQWKEIEEYALSGFNLEDKHCQDDEKQALIQPITHQLHHQQFHTRIHCRNQ